MIVAVDAAPLSPGQERLLGAEYLGPDGEPPPPGKDTPLRPIDTCAIHLKGPLDVGAMRAAVEALVERQDALRTTFRFRDGLPPVQVVAATHPSPFRAEDVPRPESLEGITDRLLGPTQHAPSPSADDLFHVRLARFSTNESVLLLRIHHLVSDGWSIGVLYRELSELYAAAAERRAHRLPELSVSFPQACVQMWTDRRRGAHRHHLERWRRLLAPPFAPALFPAMGATADGLMAVDDLKVSFASDRVAALRGASRTAAAPGGLAGPLLASLAIVLAARTGDEEVRVGVMVANRAKPEREHLVGNFVNIVVLRIRIDVDAAVAQLVGSVNESIVAALDTQDVPVQDVLADASAAWGADVPDPVYQVTLAMNELRAGGMWLPSVRGTDIAGSGAAAIAGPRDVSTSVELRCVFEERDGGLVGSITYNRTRFTRSSIKRLVADVRRATDVVAADPAARVGDVLTPSRRFNR